MPRQNFDDKERLQELSLLLLGHDLWPKKTHFKHNSCGFEVQNLLISPSTKILSLDSPFEKLLESTIFYLAS